MSTQKLILASSSKYRKELLQKLTHNFSCVSPNIDESPIENEQHNELVARLALEKARAIAKDHVDALIIGSDQIAVVEEEIMTKPHTHEKAIEQLTNSSGKELTFLTSLCLYNSKTEQYQLETIPFKVTFLELTYQQIESYLQKEQPYDCAGSFKSEALGIALFSSMEGEDPNSLIGLPLIALTKMLRQEGIEPLNL